MATGTATAPARNGRAAPPKFQPGFEPEVIALKAIPGKGVTGYSGDQVLFHLTDNRPWYAEIYVAQKIEQARIQAGEPFEVSKVQKQRGGRTITEVDVKRLSQKIRRPHRVKARAPDHLQGKQQIATNWILPRPGYPSQLPPSPHLPLLPRR